MIEFTTATVHQCAKIARKNECRPIHTLQKRQINNCVFLVLFCFGKRIMYSVFPFPHQSSLNNVN